MSAQRRRVKKGLEHSAKLLLHRRLQSRKGFLYWIPVPRSYVKQRFPSKYDVLVALPTENSPCPGVED